MNIRNYYPCQVITLDSSRQSIVKVRLLSQTTRATQERGYHLFVGNVSCDNGYIGISSNTEDDMAILEFLSLVWLTKIVDECYISVVEQGF